jgi:hypothetical protein
MPASDEYKRKIVVIGTPAKHRRPLDTHGGDAARQYLRDSVQFLNLPVRPNYPNLARTAKTAEGETRNVQSRENKYRQTPEQCRYCSDGPPARRGIRQARRRRR